MVGASSITDLLMRPQRLFSAIANHPLSTTKVFFGYALWLGLLPPVSAYLGVSRLGWQLGIGEAVVVEPSINLTIAILYYLVLLTGFFVASYLLYWMTPTYGGKANFARCASFIAIIGTPLMLGGLLHLYPSLPLNLLCLLPALIWSTYLLYTGLPVAFAMEPARSFLMASSILAVFFVATVSIAGLTMMFWVLGIGPNIGFDWQLSISG